MDHAVTVSVETEPTAISAVRYSQSWVLLLYVYLQLQCCDAALHCSSPSPGGRSLSVLSALSPLFRFSAATAAVFIASSFRPYPHAPPSVPPALIPSINPSFPDPLLPSHPRTLTPPAAMAAKVYACHPSLSSPNQSTLPPSSSLAFLVIPRLHPLTHNRSPTRVLARTKLPSSKLQLKAQTTGSVGPITKRTP